MRPAPATALAALLTAATLTGSLVGARGAQATMVPYVIGGQRATVAQYPWQVLVITRASPTLEVLCGGSILDSMHILTAAHCIDQEGTTTQYPVSEIGVLAGADNVNSFEEEGIVPAGAQFRAAALVRAHPDYAPLPGIRDDVAVITLSAGLTLSPSKNAVAIGLVESGATLAPGTALSVSGYGKQSGLEGKEYEPDGYLYATSLTAISSDACRNAVGVNSAVLLCAGSASSSACQGDSGGPLTQGSPAVQVGVVDFGGKGCPIGSANVFTNLAAPEVRAFIEGSEAPPLAARPTGAPVLHYVGGAPVDYSPMTCDPGSWNAPAAFSYTFQTEGPGPQLLQNGPSNTFTPASGAVGFSIVCVVHAANAGGLSTARSGASPALTLDMSPPSAKVTGRPRCRLRACTVSLTASDPNSVALTVTASASYEFKTRCTVMRRHRRVSVACKRTRTVAMKLAGSGPRYTATVKGLPYGVRVRFAVSARNAAGLRQHAASATSATLAAPRKSSQKH